MTMQVFFVCVAMSVVSALNLHLPKHNALALSGVNRSFFPSLCFSKSGLRVQPHALIQFENPGSGLGKIEPFVKILKDGFVSTGCVKDKMFEHGDKFGDGKFNYRLGEISNVSIVHYTDVIAKEDRLPMTPTVCFDFCRTVPDMGFFGIINGRDCYCENYYQAMAGDSSQCDAPCDGAGTSMCGGKTKSSIFEMHNCNDGGKVLGAAALEAYNVKLQIDDLVPLAKSAAEGKNELAARFQASFGASGDVDAAAMMQVAKVSAGKLLEAAKATEKFSVSMKGPIDETVVLTGLDLNAFASAQEDEAKGSVETAVEGLVDQSKMGEFQKYDVAKKGDLLGADMKKITPEAEKALAALQEIYLLSEPEVNPAFFVKSGPCTTDEVGCVMSPKGTGGTYFNHEECTIEIMGGESIQFTVEEFRTETYYDHLTVNGVQYNGAGAVRHDWKKSKPTIQTIKEASGEIKWYTDYSVKYSGFKICGKTEVKDNEQRGLQYYPAMYFVDKDFQDVPMTCSGTPVGDPIYFKTYHLCAAACDAAVESCVGFSYYPTGPNKPNMCFLLSDFKTGMYYTGCKQSKGFLQKQNATKLDQPLDDEPTHPVCVAKLSKFVGTTLKPNPSGKCKQCMTKLTKADRCYE